MVDIIPKAPRQYSLISRAAFVLAVSSFILTLGSFLILWYLQGRSASVLFDVEERLTAGRTQEQNALEANVFSSRTRLQDFSSLLALRKNFLPAFLFLETTVHPNVYFPGVSVNAARQTLELRGKATSFAVLDEQLAIFEAREEPGAISLTSLRLSETGGVDFQLGIQFPPQFFQ